MKDYCKKALEAAKVAQEAIDNAIEDKDQKDWRKGFDEWVNSIKELQIVPAERPTPKPILVAYVGTAFLCKLGDREVQEVFMDQIVIDLNTKLKGEYHVISSTSSIDEFNVIFKVL